ncbi:MAG: ATP-binding cassette domain-containing protein, partial [Gammaproteobacteria bacterium]|nr:ATP-binding cassette domain-containing protein [Gammaproteobacteria bacterium]
MIDVQSLAKRFGQVTALGGVSFAAERGKITGLLGPNGAGKSTCLRILSTVMRADSGRATIGGVDVAGDPLAVRRLCGVLPHGAGLYPQLTAIENIRYYGELHGLGSTALDARIAELVDRLDLGGIAERRAKGFSQGERTKVALARALVNDPDYLLLDEPTSGLDVMATRDLRSWLVELRQRGCAILLSSHVMQEIAALADELVIIANGQLAARGTPGDLTAQFGTTDLEQVFVDAVNSVAAVPAAGA